MTICAQASFNESILQPSKFLNSWWIIKEKIILIKISFKRYLIKNSYTFPITNIVTTERKISKGRRISIRDHDANLEMTLSHTTVTVISLPEI